MKSAKNWDLFVVFFLLAGGAAMLSANGCVGNPDDPENQDGETQGPPEPVGDNVMKVTVNGSLCGRADQQYANEPCVSVTICAPGTKNCQTIDNILLDTGSYGLRVYGSLITVPLQPVVIGHANLAECVQFGDNSSEWGPVQYADVQLADEPAVQVPIMVINSHYSNPPGPCTTAQSRPDIGPSQTGFNGILGVGLLTADCGSTCVTDRFNGQYYACSGTSCVPSAAPLASQVQNPVSFLPRDNNGVILRLPDVPNTGVKALEGSLILGIGTQPNNQPGGVKVYGADDRQAFTATFAEYDSHSITSFIDSGSSVLFFPPPTSGTLPDCASAAGGSHGNGYAGFYCPASNLTFSATNESATSAVTGSVPFQTGNAFELFATGNMVFSNMADSSSIGYDAVFDWGLPFFYGRDVYVGIEGKNSPLGSGPYWAY